MPAPISLARTVFLVLVIAPGAALAAQFDYSIYAGVEHSNNITLSADNRVSQTVLVPGFAFTFAQQGAALQANVAGVLEYHDYLGNRFDSQTQTQLDGQANWTVLPQRLDFSVEDHAGVQPVDSLASNSPGNQQQTNVLSIGPTLHLRFGNALRGQAELRYVNSYASKTDNFNSSRGVAALRLFRDINPTDQLSVNAEAQRVTFDNSDQGSNYNRNELFVGYTSKLAKFDVNTVLGWSQLNFDHAPSDSSPLARLTLGWRPTLRSTFAVTGAYQYADAAQDVMSSSIQATNNVGGGISSGNTVIDSQVYLEKLLEASYTFHTERLTLFVAPLYRKLHYLNDPTFDQVGRGGSVNLTYLLRPTLVLSAFVTGERLTYQTLDRRDRTIRFGVDLNRQWTLHWSGHVLLTRQRRDSDAVDQGYRETRISLNVVFRR
jgi:hypothetical protein